METYLMPFDIRRAQRKRAKLRCGLIGASGSGKTMSALKLAFGLGERVGLVDTEHASSEMYADLGEYDVIQLDAPYTVARYREAIQAFEKAGYGTIVVDSLSHSWASEGGLLDKQNSLVTSGKYKSSFDAWREVTPDFTRLVEELLNSPAHILCTLRTKVEWVVEKDERGRNVPRKIGTSPIHRDTLEYELGLVFELSDNHYARASKDRMNLFDGWSNIITEEVGKTIREWLDGGAPEVLKPPAPKPERKLTIAQWLDALQAELAAAQDTDGVEAIATRSDVQKALGAFRNGALTRLREMLDAAREGAAEDAIWPPDAPDAARLSPGERVAWPGPAPEKEAA
jgi:hypothetical protein